MNHQIPFAQMNIRESKTSNYALWATGWLHDPAGKAIQVTLMVIAEVPADFCGGLYIRSAKVETRYFPTENIPQHLPYHSWERKQYTYTPWGEQSPDMMKEMRWADLENVQERNKRLIDFNPSYEDFQKRMKGKGCITDWGIEQLGYGILNMCITRKRVFLQAADTDHGMTGKVIRAMSGKNLEVYQQSARCTEPQSPTSVMQIPGYTCGRNPMRIKVDLHETPPFKNQNSGNTCTLLSGLVTVKGVEHSIIPDLPASLRAETHDDGDTCYYCGDCGDYISVDDDRSEYSNDCCIDAHESLTDWSEEQRRKVVLSPPWQTYGCVEYWRSRPERFWRNG